MEENIPLCGHCAEYTLTTEDAFEHFHDYGGEIWVIHNSVAGMIGYATSEQLAEEAIQRWETNETRYPKAGQGKRSRLFKKLLTKLPVR